MNNKKIFFKIIILLCLVSLAFYLEYNVKDYEGTYSNGDYGVKIETHKMKFYKSGKLAYHIKFLDSTSKDSEFQFDGLKVFLDKTKEPEPIKVIIKKNDDSINITINDESYNLPKKEDT